MSVEEIQGRVGIHLGVIQDMEATEEAIKGTMGEGQVRS